MKNFEHKAAYRSISDPNGETDVLWILKNGENTFMVLVENKIKAPSSQGDQHLRYIERGDDYIKRGYCIGYKVVLLAPENYESEDAENYDDRISYEDVAKWCQKQGDRRSLYIAYLYEEAIKKLGQKVTSEKMTEFHRQIRELGRDEFPALNVPEPKEVGGTDDWLYMRHSRYTLVYKMLKTSEDKTKSTGEYVGCVVDLQLADRGKDKELLEKRYGSTMKTEGIKIKETGKSASFRLKVPLIKPPEFDERKVREAFRQAKRLKDWWENNRIEGD